MNNYFIKILFKNTYSIPLICKVIAAIIINLIKDPNVKLFFFANNS